jgi:hypothetical protein
MLMTEELRSFRAEDMPNAVWQGLLLLVFYILARLIEMDERRAFFLFEMMKYQR